MENETQLGFSKRFSLPVLLLVLVIGVAAGITAFAVSSVFGASALSSDTSQQSTAPTTTASHNCTLASIGYLGGSRREMVP